MSLHQMMTHTTSGVTVLRRKLEQSAFFELSGGLPAVPVTARAQLSALQARLSSTAIPRALVI